MFPVSRFREDFSYFVFIVFLSSIFALMHFYSVFTGFVLHFKFILGHYYLFSAAFWNLFPILLDISLHIFQFSRKDPLIQIAWKLWDFFTSASHCWVNKTHNDNFHFWCSPCSHSAEYTTMLPYHCGTKCV